MLTGLIYESLLPLETEDIPGYAKVLDVGSGAGIPALPMKFVRPDLQMTLVESRRHKAAFLRRAVEELHLEGVEVVKARLEEVYRRSDRQEAFDVITTRGTGSATTLYPMMNRLVKRPGSIWFYKGIARRKEAEALASITSNTIRILELNESLCLIIVDTHPLPSESLKHHTDAS